MAQNVYVGMDIGTTNSCVSILYPNGSVKVVEDELGKRVIRSAVCFKEGGKRVVGYPAVKDIAAINTGNVVMNAKRIIGLKFSDPRVKTAMASCKAKVVEGDNGYAAFWIPVLGRKVYPEEIYAEIINTLWNMVRKQTEDKIACVAITCPAMYKNEERVAIKRAIDASVVDCEVRMLNEPCAAAIAYGCHNTDQDGLYAVYDLGGGTLDVSLIQVQNGNLLKILNWGGDPTIGGQLFDDDIVRYVRSSYQEAEGDDLLNEEDRLTNLLRYNRLLFNLSENCRLAKEELVSTDETTIDIDSYIRFLMQEYQMVIEDPIEMVENGYTLTLKILNDMIHGYIETTIQILERCISESYYTLDDVDKVLLVGGSSRLRLVHDCLEKKFGVSRCSQEVNPDTVVSSGAALYAYHKILRDITIEEPVKWDVCTMTCNRGENVYDPIIERGSMIPATGVKDYAITSIYEGYFCDNIFEGDLRDPKTMKMLKFFACDNVTIQDDPVIVRYTFEIREDGILHYKVEEFNTGRVLQEDTIIHTD